jgi:putative ABC transport system permease protein
MSFEDYRMLRQQLTRVQGVAFNATMRGQNLRAEGRSVSNIEVVGTTHDLLNIVDLQIEEGRYFSPIESHLGNPVCMVGANIATSLFPDRPAVGQNIRVGGKRFLIIGTRKKQGANLFGGTSEDDKIWIPYTIMSTLYNLNGRGSEKMIMIKAATYEDLPYVESETEGIIRNSRGLKPKAESNFAINKQEALMNRMGDFFGYLDLGGWVISIFSILIGGFSIGNIMYISVRERTSEIGVQKALGSTRSFLLFQYITESVMICLLGGLIGLGLVFLMGMGIQAILNALSVPLTISFASGDIMTGLGLAAGIGLLSGFVPATMAATLDPVTAIRHS